MAALMRAAVVWWEGLVLFSCRVSAPAARTREPTGYAPRG
jgi:hypothetical protein